MEITKREIILSIAIISFMMIVGIMLSGKISDSITDKNAVYNKAIHVEGQELFQYGIRTNVGNAFIYGDLVAIDTVTYPEIDGEYLYVKKVKERYTQHTRTVSYKCGKSTCHRTETYWTWDRAGSEDKISEKVEFLDVEFNFNQFLTPSDHHLVTIKESSHIRYKYYVVPSKLTGTIFADLRENNIGDNVPIYQDMDTDEAYKHLTNSDWIMWLFWMGWLVLTGGAVYGFWYLENDWLY